MNKAVCDLCKSWWEERPNQPHHKITVTGHHWLTPQQVTEHPAPEFVETRTFCSWRCASLAIATPVHLERESDEAMKRAIQAMQVERLRRGGQHP